MRLCSGTCSRVCPRKLRSDPPHAGIPLPPPPPTWARVTASPCGDDGAIPVSASTEPWSIAHTSTVLRRELVCWGAEAPSADQVMERCTITDEPGRQPGWVQSEPRRSPTPDRFLHLSHHYHHRQMANSARPN
jgi:hypothetical protein